MKGISKKEHAELVSNPKLMAAVAAARAGRGKYTSLAKAEKTCSRPSRQAASIQKIRAERRTAGKCVQCGQLCKTYRCSDCCPSRGRTHGGARPNSGPKLESKL